MSAASDRRDDAVEAAATALRRIQAEVAAARQELAGLLNDIVLADRQLSNHMATRLLEANEQLTLASLRHQSQVDTATQALDEVTREAELDPLTRLPNRVLLNDRLMQAIAAAKRRRGHFALLFLDLNDFKSINDNFGHGTGDEVLQEVARRLASAVRDADTVSRHGGDEFLVLLPEVAEPSDASLIAAKLQKALMAPCRIGPLELLVTASVGIAIYPGDGRDVRTLIDRADAAMYRDKRRGRSRPPIPPGVPG